MALRWCTRTTTCWSSTSRPAWSCIRRRQLERHPAERPARPRCRRRAAAARRHRAPARQGHQRPDGGRRRSPPRPRWCAPSPRARCIASTWRSPTALAGAAHAASTRRSAAIRAPACAWRWWPAAGRHAPTSNGWPWADGGRVGQRACAARCTPAARTRSACTWPRAAIRWWATRCTAAAPPPASARQALHAVRLAFVHPRSGDALAFEAPPPADLAAAWRSLPV